jgi:hypothetical protein
LSLASTDRPTKRVRKRVYVRAFLLLIFRFSKMLRTTKKIWKIVDLRLDAGVLLDLLHRPLPGFADQRYAVIPQAIVSL